ncbi:unnamed protein product [Spodoptera littoralis]|uniref:Uncharacterized protein n=1 Tax=Spodoptera littoralis TaxID=7109 RepID=A0A9P0N5L2_SPOLI|nr:unnamed protein product [Spodoptera littoralis]CAH1643278.1 unnamed protein product [Spodoptera littoralis]
MPNFHPIDLKLTVSYKLSSPILPLGGGNYRNPFKSDAYVITSICMPNFNPIGLKLTKPHTTFIPYFTPLGVEIIIILSQRMPTS